ncbi:4725_t:CDS:1, partial [Racocetra persica]
PGYFETKVLEKIADQLDKIFINTRIIENFNCILQTTSQYLLEVIVPETTIHLIMDNLECEYVDTTDIMKENVLYRLIVNLSDKKP